MIFIVIIVRRHQRCVALALEVTKLTALLVLVMYHRWRAAHLAAFFLHLPLESALMLDLFMVRGAVVEVVISVVLGPLVIILLLIVVLCPIVDLLQIFVFFLVCIVLLRTHVLIVLLLRVQKLHMVFLKIRLAFGHTIVWVVRHRCTLLNHLVLVGWLLLASRGLLRGRRDVHGEIVEIEGRHLVRAGFNVDFEQIEARVAGLTVKCNVALTFDVLVLLRRVVGAPEVAPGRVAHATLC